MNDPQSLPDLIEANLTRAADAALETAVDVLKQASENTKLRQYSEGILVAREIVKGMLSHD